MTALATTFETPTIDAQIAQLHESERSRRAAQFQQTKEILSAAIFDGSIYNVDLVDAKEGFARVIEAVLRDMHSAYWNQYRAYIDQLDAELRDAVWAIVDTSLQLNHVVGRIKRAEKFANRLRGIEPFIAVYREALPFAQAVEQLKAKIIKGRKPLENPKPVDLSNTGICAICQHRQKLTAGKKLVHHGFAISDGRGHYFGFRSGSCFGVRRTPYELSCEANIEFIKALEAQVVRTQERIRSLNAGEVTEIGRMEVRRDRGQKIQEYKVYKVGDDIFPQLVGHELASANMRLAQLKLGIEHQQLLVKNWTPKPLLEAA